MSDKTEPSSLPSLPPQQHHLLLVAEAARLDPVKVDPTRHKVEVENDKVRVLRIKIKAGDTTKQHEHPNGVAIFLTDVKTRFTRGDGTTREAANKRGEAIWAAPENHAVHNVARRPAEIILVELK